MLQNYGRAHRLQNKVQDAEEEIVLFDLRMYCLRLYVYTAHMVKPSHYKLLVVLGTRGLYRRAEKVSAQTATSSSWEEVCCWPMLSLFYLFSCVLIKCLVVEKSDWSVILAFFLIACCLMKRLMIRPMIRTRQIWMMIHQSHLLPAIGTGLFDIFRCFVN